jgi:hypothetical protein
MSLRITLIGSTNFLCFPAIAGRRLQPKGRSNSPILCLQLEGVYNPMCSLATTRRWLQEPIISLSNDPEIQVSNNWWNHCHTVTMKYATVNLYQSVPTTYNQPIPKTCSQPEPITCNQPVPITYHQPITTYTTTCTENLLNISDLIT